MFNGFTQETADFLFELSLNNNKEWFGLHKEQYKRVLQEPMKELTEEVFADFLTYGESTMISSISRIQKDARFSHDFPYRDNCWFTFKEKREDWWAMPAYYFEFSSRGWAYGMGMWSSVPTNMQKLRDSIDEDPKKLEKIARQLEKNKTFMLDGEEYKRPKGNISPLLNPWYNKKGLSLNSHHTFTDKAVFSREVFDILCRDFRKLVPACEYMKSAFMR